MSYDAEGQAEYRRKNPDYVRRSTLQKQARVKALGILQRRHKAEFDNLYDRCCKELEIDPPRRWASQ